MGFILSFCSRTFVRCYMTILIVNGLWQYQRFVVYGALDQSSREQKQPYFEDDNHVQSHENLLNEDGWCHCRDQGPWHPLFKPSHPMPAASSVEETLPALENAIDASEHTNQIQALPSDVHANSPNHLRKAKKQNHMIHLHLIPHIYVPVLHPVRHPVTYSVQNGDHHYPQITPSSLESQDSHESRPHSYENYDRPLGNVPSDVDNEIGFHEDHSSEHTIHHDDHSPYVPPEPGQDLSQETVNQDAPNYINSHSLGHINHESDEFNYNTLSDVHYRRPPNTNIYNSEEHTATSHHHQYQVHEESPHEHYYGDYPAGSNTKTQILPLNGSRHVNYFKQKTKQKHQDRSKLNKKYMILPIQVKKLRVMRPPPPGQRETWRTNFEQADSKLVPVKAFFDSKDLFKHPFFDFKSSHNKPSYRVSMYQPTSGNVVPVPLSKPSYSKLSKSPILVYPSNTNALRRRRDKILRS